MSEINASNFKKEHGDLAPDLVGVTELTSPYFFVPPSGTTAERVGSAFEKLAKNQQILCINKYS